jgi:predicted ribosome quality control (RQC) complex YloA/Tae2 family protein
MVRVFELENRIIVQVGQNALENDLIRKKAKQNWTWFHLEGQPSPHIIVDCPLNELDGNTIRDAGLLCARFSKSKTLASARCIYTLCRNVHNEKTPGLVSLKSKPEVCVVYPQTERVEQLMRLEKNK